MAAKRGCSPELVSNPYIKKENLEWTFDLSHPAHDSSEDDGYDVAEEHGLRVDKESSRASAVEAGKAKVEDYLGYFSGLLKGAILSPFPPDSPRLSINAYQELYERNSGNPQGAHFIVHQHDHPIAGTHYDLRLQINETSSASWAIMYGLPGDPNSQRLNRNATETRIHCLWNHLIETASISTGSLLIWDTGTYNILPPRESTKRANLNSQSDDEEEDSKLTEQEKLHQAFQARKIRIRLNGTRLPHDYVLNLRLTKEEDVAGRAKSTRTPTRRRRRGAPVQGRGSARGKGKRKAAEIDTNSDSDPDEEATGSEESGIVTAPAEEVGLEDVSTMEREIRELEDEQVRRTNAYPGAENSIGSVHQRRWYLSLDREACGFSRRRKAGRVVWEARDVERGGDSDDNENRLTFPFYVRGAEIERSVVTGRTGTDVLKDEEVVGHVARKGWRPVLN
ncbi:DNA polymerase ligase-domain-containing protein [Daldinia sp. FL1419]|nr:DNA polymerase ligase-domain-containing protein [Daldinia sp. FL1419]